MTRNQWNGRLELALAITFGVWLGGCFLAASQAAEAAESGQAREDVTREQVLELMQYNRTINLGPDQQAVFDRALAAIPAPCCDSFSAKTCCCECNLTRAVWGLAKHLIADEGAAAADVQAEVREWLASTNPSEYTGDACFKGGCGRPFARNGCGGMDESRLVF